MRNEFKPNKCLIEIKYHYHTEFNILLYHDIWTEEFIRAKLEHGNCRAKQILMKILRKYLKNSNLSWNQTTESDIDIRMISMRKFHASKLVGKCKGINEIAKIREVIHYFVTPQQNCVNKDF